MKHNQPPTSFLCFAEVLAIHRCRARVGEEAERLMKWEEEAAGEEEAVQRLHHHPQEVVEEGEEVPPPDDRPLQELTVAPEKESLFEV